MQSELNFNTMKLRSSISDLKFIKRYHCVHCKMQFHPIKIFQAHVKTHQSEKPFKCTFCPRTFSRINYLNKHSKIHAKEKQSHNGSPVQIKSTQKDMKHNKLSDLNKLTNSKSNTSLDMTTKESSVSQQTIKQNKEALTCKICQQTFNEESDLIKHSESDPNSYVCYVDSESLIEDSDYFLGKNAEIRMKDSSVRCHDIAKCANSNAEEHKKRKRYFQCTYCEKSYTEDIILEEHLKTHTTILPFNCKFCNEPFAGVDDLTLHAMSHLENNPEIKFDFESLQAEGDTCNSSNHHNCRFCNEAFYDENHLLEHEKLHIDIKPFNCKYCEEPFSGMEDLMKHAKIHIEDEKLFPTEN